MNFSLVKFGIFHFQMDLNQTARNRPAGEKKYNLQREMPQAGSWRDMGRSELGRPGSGQRGRAPFKPDQRGPQVSGRDGRRGTRASHQDPTAEMRP